MQDPPRYARPEYERRWLVLLDRMPPVDGLPVRRIEDRYVLGTRLRLRRVMSEGAGLVLKLGRKYGRSGDQAEPVVSVYLDAAEFDLLAGLPAAVACKLRYTVAEGSLDVYQQPAHGLRVFEHEFLDAATMTSYRPPDFVGAEITGQSAFSGYALAGVVSAGSPSFSGGRLLPVRLGPGAELRSALLDVVAGTGAGGAFVVSGMGSLAGAHLRFAGRDAAVDLPGDLEILALSGTLGPDGAHLHISVADAEGRVFGGHVSAGCRIRTTLEVLIVLLDDWSLARAHDPATGFDELEAIPRP